MESQERWSDSLIEDIVDKIHENKIVPIIGPAVYCIKEFDKEYSIQDYLTKLVLKEYDEFIEDAHKTKQLVSRSGYRGMTELDKVLAKANKTTRTILREKYSTIKSRITMNAYVQDFLDYGDFPLVLTTCNFEMLSDRIHYKGRDYKTLSYKKVSSISYDMDISFEEGSQKMKDPTIFHLFGKIGSDKNCGVITENDFLQYLHCLQDSGTCPRKLKDYLKDKYILSLGCEIPDWTFRFMLYSLKEENGALKGEIGDNSFDGGVVSERLDNDLSAFLSDICYFSHTDLDNFLNDVNRRIMPINRPKIFLSMCHEEYDEIGEKIKRKLNDRFEVWLFPDNKDMQYWKKIEEGIVSCDYFMPVITDKALVALYSTGKIEADISNAKDEEKGLITEWQLALEHKRRFMGDKKYCVPYNLVSNWDNFKNALKTKDPEKRLLWPLFFPQEGAEAFAVPLPELTAAKLESYLKQ